jgi:hypothetical protein
MNQPCYEMGGAVGLRKGKAGSAVLGTLGTKAPLLPICYGVGQGGISTGGLRCASECNHM